MAFKEKDVLAIIAFLPDNTFTKNYLQFAYLGSDAPAHYHLLSVLSALSAASPTTLSIPIFNTHVYACVSYNLCVGGSGSRKTHAFEQVLENIITPVCPEVIGEAPGTVEGAMRSLKAQPRQLQYYRELNSFLAQTQLTYAAPLRDFYVKMYDAPDKEERVLGNAARSFVVHNPRIALHACTTSSALSSKTDIHDWTGGFMSRFRIAYSVKRTRTYAGPQAGFNVTLPAAREHLDFIYRSPVGLCRGFSTDALLLWNQFVYKYEAENALSNNSYSEGAGARRGTMTAQAALLFALDLQPEALTGEDWWIDVHALKLAQVIDKMSMDSTRLVVASLTPTEYTRKRNTVASLFDHHDVLTFSDVMRKVNPKLPKRECLQIMESLVAEETVYMTHDGMGRGRAVYSDAKYSSAPFPSLVSELRH